MVAFEAGEPGPRPGLGTNGITVTPFEPSRVSGEAFRAARRDRFARRVVSSQWLVDQAVAEHGGAHFAEFAPAPATCGWAAGSHVGVNRSAAGVARFSGVQTCASVWSCPCCGSVIRGRRSEEVQRAAKWWEGQRGQFLFVTFTVRHRLEDSLERTMDAVTNGFTATINGAPWKRFAKVHGIRHFIKSQEVTLGWANGWHAHLHVLFFVDLAGAAADAQHDANQAWVVADQLRNKDGSMNRRYEKRAKRLDVLAEDALHAAEQGISEARAKELHPWLSDRWRSMVVAAGGREPSNRRGVDIRTVHDGRVVALYISKLQDGDRPKKWEVGPEMTRQDMKKGRVDSLVPLELLDLDGLTDEEVERNRVAWLEYVETTSGRRSMTWSRGLKVAAGIEELDDEDLAKQEAADAAEDDLAVLIPKSQWHAIRADAGQQARVLELVEADDFEELARLIRFEYPPGAPPSARPPCGRDCTIPAHAHR